MTKFCLILTMALMLAAASVFTSGCMTTTHRVGNGGTNTAYVEDREWYLLWGLVPLNDDHGDTTALSGTEQHYTIKTQMTAVDVIISIVTGWVSVITQTVRITK